MASTLDSWRAYTMRGAALLLLGTSLAACTLTLDSTALIQACVRNADCETGLVCDVGTCLPPVLDGGAEAADANETVDSGLPPPADAGESTLPGPGQSDGGVMDADADAGESSPPRTDPSDAGADTDAASGADDAGSPDAALGIHDAGPSSPDDAGSDEGSDGGLDGGSTVGEPSDAGLEGNDGGIATNDSGTPAFQDGGEL